MLNEGHINEKDLYINNRILRKYYNSLYQRIRYSRNSLIVQLCYYNVLCPSQLFTLWFKSVH